MKKSKFLFPLSLGLVSFALVACGGGSDTDTSKKEDSSGASGTSEPISATSEYSEPPSELINLNDDIELDDDGTVYFDNVEVKVWAVGGDPDASTMDNMIKAFNREYAGQITIVQNHINEENYYTQLDNAFANDQDSLPDFYWIHSEKVPYYAGTVKEYLLPMTPTVMEHAQLDLDFSLAYENIDRTNILKGTRYGIPVDCHGFLEYVRADIIKKNGVGFDGNTRFIPQTGDEYFKLLNDLYDIAAKGQLWTRNITKNADHTWKQVGLGSFNPTFNQSTDPDGLSALYSNGGSLMDAAEETVTFGENAGFRKYVTDQVLGYQKGLITGNGTNTAAFAAGQVAMFNEGPWWSAIQYEPDYNNADLRTANPSLGVSAEDAADPIYSKPLQSCNTAGWWTLPENKDLPNADTWYGHGHSICINRNLTSYNKVAAIFEFAKWYTQGKDANDKYVLPTWCKSGHAPAWKNVYESAEYEDVKSKSATLQGLGDPAKMVSLESLTYEPTLFTAIQAAVTQVQSACIENPQSMTVEQAIAIIESKASTAQEEVDQLKIFG